RIKVTRSRLRCPLLFGCRRWLRFVRRRSWRCIDVSPGQFASPVAVPICWRAWLRLFPIIILFLPLVTVLIRLLIAVLLLLLIRVLVFAGCFGILVAIGIRF